MREEQKPADVAVPDVEMRAQAAPRIQRPYTLAEIKAKIASNDYSAELLLQHAMLLLEGEAAPAAVAGPSERVAFEMWVRKSTTEVPHRDQYGFYDEPVSEWWKVWQARAAAPTTQAALLEALKEAQAGLEFAAARLPHTTGFVPSHIAALNIVNAALAAAPTTQAAPQPAAQQGDDEEGLIKTAFFQHFGPNANADWHGEPGSWFIEGYRAAQQPAPVAQPAILGPEHKGMRVDYSGLFKQARGALARGIKEPALAEMLRQFQGHMQELGQRWYAGDTAVIDELLQLYCIEQGARAQAKEGGA